MIPRMAPAGLMVTKKRKLIKMSKLSEAIQKCGSCPKAFIRITNFMRYKMGMNYKEIQNRFETETGCSLGVFEELSEAADNYESENDGSY